MTATDFPTFDWRLPLTDPEQHQRLLDQLDEVLAERRPQRGWLTDKPVEKRRDSK